MQDESPQDVDRRRRRPESSRRLTWWRLTLYRLAAPIALGIIYGWWWIIPRGRVLGRERLEAALAEHKSVIPVFWHGQQLLPFRELVWYPPRGLRLGQLSSPSVDAELPVMLARSAGITVIRGSSTRTGAQALRALYKAVVNQDVSPVIVPDGSHGPRRVFKPGAIFLSQLSGRPIVPMAYAARHAWLFPTWDRFTLPWPFTRVLLIIGEPRIVPKGLDKLALERCRQEMGAELDRLYEEALAAL